MNQCFMQFGIMIKKQGQFPESMVFGERRNDG
jgi:hypothetical protein